MKRELAKRHEDDIAALFGGQRSKTSGGSPVDKGDVRVTDESSLIECKYTGSPGGKRPIKKATMIRRMEKIAYEAYEEGKDPALALRYYDPDSALANKSTGYVDLIVRLAGDDAYRSERLKIGDEDRSNKVIS